jgi:uncharacterized protein (TIGR03437 family)
MRRTLILATFMVAGSLHATQPTVAAIQDATGFKGLPVGTGKLASIYGTNLANVTEDTTGNPYPNIVSGTSVQFGTSSGWEYAPLVYLSPTQLNVQIPWTLDLTGQVIVTSPYGTADFSGPGASYEGWNYTASPSYYLNNGTPIITLQNGTLYTGQALASGSYVSLWINGGGQTSPDQTTGYVDSGLAWFQAGDFDYYVYYSSSENAIIGGTAPYCASGPNIVYDCATGSPTCAASSASSTPP